MDAKLKWGIVGVGAVLIIGATMMRGGRSGGDDEALKIMTDANVTFNSAAMQLRMVQVNAAADMVMNRDKITGATEIAALQIADNIIANNGAVNIALTESYNGIINNRIQSQTAQAIEATRASVQKKALKYQYKLGKKGANMDFASDLIGSTFKALPSIIGAF